MGVTSLFGLVGCAKAQIGKLVFNLDNPDYGLNVAAMMSSLLDTTQQKIEARYKVDTLKFYNTETDEPFPPLVAYRNKGGSKRTEATFRGFNFTELGMVTTEQGTLVQVKGKKNTDEEGFAKLVKAATKKYGKPHFEEGTDFEGRPGQLYRWETKKEYIQLYAKSNSSKDTLVIATAGNENGLVNMENDKPCLDVTLWRWKKEYHDWLVFELDYCVLGEEAQKLSSLSNIQSAENYTPAWVKPFFIFRQVSLLTSYIPIRMKRHNNGFCHFFPPFRFTIIRNIGAQLFVLHQFRKLHAFFHLASHICCGAKSVFEIAFKLFKLPARKASLTVDFYRICYTGFIDYFTVRNTVIETGFDFSPYITRFFQSIQIMCSNEERLYGRGYDMEYKTAYMMEIQEELRKSGLDLEHTTARLVRMPAIPLAFFTDGKKDMFMNIDKQGYSIYTPNGHEWKAGKVYRLYDYLINW